MIAAIIQSWAIRSIWRRDWKRHHRSERFCWPRNLPAKRDGFLISNRVCALEVEGQRSAGGSATDLPGAKVSAEIPLADEGLRAPLVGRDNELEEIRPRTRRS